MFTKKEKPKANSIESNKRAPFFQAKLKVGKAGDKYEVEADKMADKVVNNDKSSNAVQKKEGEEEVQQKPLASEISPLIQKAETLEEEPVQKMDEEEPVQKKEEEEVQQKEEEEPVQMMEEEEPVQKKEEEEVQQKEEEEVQTKSTNNSNKSPSIEGKLRNGSGGTKMDNQTKNEMESGFGADFSQVNIHNDNEAAQMSQDIGAQAFTHGNDVYFNKGKYNPDSKEGKHLLAHELTHTVQQKGMVQKKIQHYKSDTGFRYNPPSTIKRSISEIQAVAGTTPDGIYGLNTKIAVENYQKKLKNAGLYNFTPDGKWGKNTEIAHVAFSTGSQAETYNCSGLAFKTFQFHGMTATKAILSSMKKLASCTDKCGAREFKFWYWEYDLMAKDTSTGATSSIHRDFHIVGGQTDGKGNNPTAVVSKNGKRPVKGPKTPMSWRPPNVENARKNSHKDTIIPNVIKIRTNRKQLCFCSIKLP